MTAALGLRLVRTNHPAIPYMDAPPQCPLDFLVTWLLARSPKRTFLQIGAHDGVRNDPLYRWITRLDWHGTLVEPMPDFAEKLRLLHARRPDVHIVTAAVVDEPTTGPLTLYRIDPLRPGLPPWAQGLSTLDPDRMLQAAHDLGLPEEAFIRLTVPVMDLSSLLARFPNRTPDLVAIDTEGYDIRLARALLTAGSRPTILHFEHGCCPVATRFAFLRELADLGYESASYGADTTAFLPGRASTSAP